MSVPTRDKSPFYDMGTPFNWPLRFCQDGYYRLKAMVSCRKCGREFGLTLKCHRFRSELGMPLASKAPDPRDEKVIAQFLINAANHGVGCANRANFNMMLEPKFGQWMPAEGDRPAVFRPSRMLKWAPHLHSKTCPIGQMVRTGEFRLTGSETRSRVFTGRPGRA